MYQYEPVCMPAAGKPWCVLGGVSTSLYTSRTAAQPGWHRALDCGRPANTVCVWYAFLLGLAVVLM